MRKPPRWLVPLILPAIIMIGLVGAFLWGIGGLMTPNVLMSAAREISGELSEYAVRRS